MVDNEVYTMSTITEVASDGLWAAARGPIRMCCMLSGTLVFMLTLGAVAPRGHICHHMIAFGQGNML